MQQGSVPLQQAASLCRGCPWPWVLTGTALTPGLPALGPCRLRRARGSEEAGVGPQLGAELLHWARVVLWAHVSQAKEEQASKALGRAGSEPPRKSQPEAKCCQGSEAARKHPEICMCWWAVLGLPGVGKGSVHMVPPGWSEKTSVLHPCTTASQSRAG